MRFAHPTGGVHRPAENHHHAVSAGGGIGGDHYRVAQVARAVGVGDVGRALRTGEHDGFRGGVDEVEQDRRLFEGVGSVGDHHAIDVGAIQLLVTSPASVRRSANDIR